jgi:hypothetical protein
MKKIALLLACMAAAVSLQAQIKVSELPAASSAATSDTSIIVQGGVTKRATLLQILNSGSGIYQQLNGNLTAIASATAATGKVPYFASGSTVAVADSTATGRGLLNISALTAAGLGLTNGSTIDAWGAISTASKLNASSGTASNLTGTGTTSLNVVTATTANVTTGTIGTLNVTGVVSGTGTVRHFTTGAAMTSATPSYAGQLALSADGSIGYGNASNFTASGLVFQNAIVYFKEIAKNGTGTISMGPAYFTSLNVTGSGTTDLSGRLVAGATGYSGPEHEIKRNGPDNVLIIRNTNPSWYSVIEFRDSDNRKMTAIGMGNSGATAEYAGRYFIASNPEGGAGFSPDLGIWQEQRNSVDGLTGTYGNYRRIFFDGTNRVIRCYGWTLGSTGSSGPLCWTSEQDGTLTVGTNLALPKTIVTTGTTGAQTINKTSGRVNFASAATSLVVTNSLVTANSIIQVTKATNDSTARLGAAVAGSGSFTIYMDVAPSAECAVNFTVTN